MVCRETKWTRRLWELVSHQGKGNENVNIWVICGHERHEKNGRDVDVLLHALDSDNGGNWKQLTEMKERDDDGSTRNPSVRQSSNSSLSHFFHYSVQIQQTETHELETSISWVKNAQWERHISIYLTTNTSRYTAHIIPSHWELVGWLNVCSVFLSMLPKHGTWNIMTEYIFILSSWLVYFFLYYNFSLFFC